MTKYKDPLHVPYKDLTVTVGDQSITLSSSFLDQQKAWDNLNEIKDHFKMKFELFSEMEKTDNKEELKDLAEKVKENEFIIQELFNFERNYNFHRFWEMPKCKCPTMDNQDSWGTKYSYHRGDCPIHGE